MLIDVAEEQHSESFVTDLDYLKPTLFVSVQYYQYLASSWLNLFKSQLDIIYLITLFSILWMLFFLSSESKGANKPK